MNLAISLFAMTVLLQAKGPDDGRAVVAEKMKALAFLVGEWDGSGAMQMGPGPKADAKVKETVQWKLSGHALLIEGLGTIPAKDGAKEQVVHEALAIITWDAKQNKYVMHAMTAKAGYVEPTIEVGEKSIIWSFEAGGGKIRYTIKIDEKNQWNEVGEFSQDGKAWNKFFEMNLTKK